MQITPIKYKKALSIKLIVCFAIILAILCYGAIAFSYNLPPFHSKASQNTTKQENKIDTNTPTDEQKATGETIKKSTAENKDAKTGDYSVVFTAINQNDGYVQIRSLIDTVANGGTCNLVLANGNITVTKNSDIQAGPSSSTCMGFDVPVSELSVGNWSATLTTLIDGNENKIIKTFTVN